MEFDCWQADALNLSTPQPLNCFCTSALSVSPFTRPATFTCNAFITAPICAFDVAPTSTMVSRTILATSPALIPCGKYPFRIDNSSFSFSAKSARPPFSKLSMESWRCFACLLITCAASASLSSVSAPDFAIAAYLKADFNMRSTPSFVVSLARIASFRSESTRSLTVMCQSYVAEDGCRCCSHGFVSYPIPPPRETLVLTARQGGGYSALAHLRTDSAPLTEIAPMSLRLRRNKPASTPP